MFARNHAVALISLYRRIIWAAVKSLGWWSLLVILSVVCCALLLMPPVRDQLTTEASLTVATWGLVVATLFLFFDSLLKGREQRRRWEREHASRAKAQAARWEREDRLREEDAKPKVVVETAKRDDAPERLCSSA
jgi:hypothetical protein